LQRFLLDVLAALVEGLHAESDEVEQVEHRDRVGQLVADRVRVAAERVECGVLDMTSKSLARARSPWSRAKSTIEVAARSVPILQSSRPLPPGPRARSPILTP